MSRFCPECGSARIPQGPFCASCGSAVSAIQPQGPVPPTQLTDAAPRRLPPFDAPVLSDPWFWIGLLFGPGYYLFMLVSGLPLADAALGATINSLLFGVLPAAARNRLRRARERREGMTEREIAKQSRRHTIGLVALALLIAGGGVVVYTSQLAERRQAELEACIWDHVTNLGLTRAPAKEQCELLGS